MFERSPIDTIVNRSIFMGATNLINYLTGVLPVDSPLFSISFTCIRLVIGSADGMKIVGHGELNYSRQFWHHLASCSLVPWLDWTSDNCFWRRHTKLWRRKKKKTKSSFFTMSNNDAFVLSVSWTEFVNRSPLPSALFCSVQCQIHFVSAKHEPEKRTESDKFSTFKIVTIVLSLALLSNETKF